MSYDKNTVPTYDQLFKPVLLALKQLGGIAENNLIDNKVAEILELSSEITDLPHGNGKRSEVSYRIAWAKTYLKKYGLIYNPLRGKWKLTEQFNGDIESIDSRQIVSFVNRQSLQTFKEAELTSLESHEAFEHFVIAGLEKYVNILHKSIETGSSNAPYDAFIPEGLNDVKIPTYVEIKYIAEKRVGKDYCLKIVRDVIGRFSNYDEPIGVLLILGVNLSQDLKNEMRQMPKSINAVSQISLIIWDYNDFTEKLGDIEINAEYLVNPKRVLIEEKLLACPSDEKLRMKREELIKSLKDEYNKQNVSLFLGAGVSQDAGIPLWGDLIHKLLLYMINEHLGDSNLEHTELEKIGQIADINKENSPLTQMRYIRAAFEEEDYYNLVHEVLYEQKPHFDTALINSLVMISTPRRNHIGVKSIVTYNFDNLVEKGLDKNSVEYRTIYRDDDIADNRKLSIYHVHGYLPEDSIYEDVQSIDLVFSEEDYHRIYRDAYFWSNIVQLNAFRDSTCLFIGCSLTDPNMRRLLDVAARNDEKPRHFAIMKRKDISLRDHTKNKFDKKLLEQYNIIDHNIREGFYQSLGINIIWVDTYDEIPSILKSLLN